MSPAKVIVKREDLKIVNSIIDLLKLTCKIYYVTDKNDEHVLKYIKTSNTYSITKFPEGKVTNKQTTTYAKQEDVIEYFRKLKCAKIIMTNDKLNPATSTLTIYKKD